MVAAMTNNSELLLDKWIEKIKDIEFIHDFLRDEVLIYFVILAEKRKTLNGSIDELAKAYNVSLETFFGFLLSIDPVIKCGVSTLRTTDTINVDLDLGALYAYLKDRESYAFLLELDGWKDVVDKASRDKLVSGKRLKVGCLRFANNPYPRMRSLSLLANSFCEEIFYFTPEKINTHKKTIFGQFYDVATEKFVEKETAYPYVIDDHGYFLAQYPDLYNELSQSCLFCYPRLQSKKKVYNVLQEGGYSQYLIDTHDYTLDIDIDGLLDKHGSLILKPNRSSQVNDVYKLYREGGFYYLQLESKVERLTRAEFVDRYTAKFLDGYLVQNYVKSVTNQGNPFNIKISVRRGKDGKWAMAKLFVRIGDVNGIVSHIQTGSGSIAFVSKLLPVEFGEHGKAIYSELLKIAKELPNTLQAGYSSLLDDLSIGVGIDRADDNHLKIFDINIETDPLSSDADVLEARYHYLMFLSKNFRGLHEMQQKT